MKHDCTGDRYTPPLGWEGTRWKFALKELGQSDYSVIRVSEHGSTHSCSEVLLVSDVLERRGCFSCESLASKIFFSLRIN